jgi:hypothetical protein
MNLVGDYLKKKVGGQIIQMGKEQMQIASVHKMKVKQRGERLINWGLGEIATLTSDLCIYGMVTSVGILNSSSVTVNPIQPNPTSSSLPFHIQIISPPCSKDKNFTGKFPQFCIFPG